MPLDDADKKFIAEAIAAATKDGLKAADLGGVLTPLLDARFKDVPTAEAVKAAADKAAADAVKGITPTPPKKTGDADDPALVAIKASLDETNRKLEASERARIDAVRAAAVDQNRTKARDALVRAGIDPTKLHLAMPAIEASGALVLDGDKPGWKGKDTYGIDGVLDFEAGAKAWAGSPDGKHFVPPVDVAGTGDRGGNRNGKGAGDVKDLNDLRGLLGAQLFTA